MICVMTSSDVFSRMTPTVLVDFISDMDDMSPKGYTDDDMKILHEAVVTLCELVGVSEAIARLAELDVSAGNPIIDAAFDEAQS